MIEKILFELIEDKKERQAHGVLCLFQILVQRECRIDGSGNARLPGDLTLKRPEKVLALPGIENDHHGIARFLLEPGHCAGQEHRTLAHTTRSVENRHRGGVQVRDNYPLVLGPPKEVLAVCLSIGLQTLVRTKGVVSGGRHVTHCASSSARA